MPKSVEAKTPQTFSCAVACLISECQKHVDRMLDESSREHLQPMQDKMEHFLHRVKEAILNLNSKLTSTQELFNKV